MKIFLFLITLFILGLGFWSSMSMAMECFAKNNFDLAALWGTFSLIIGFAIQLLIKGDFYGRK